MNTFGTLYRLTSFGESHGAALGGVIDGCPSGIHVDLNFIQQQVDRRRPGQSHITTQRHESDKIEILSGVFEQTTTGAPIAFIVRNTNHRSTDYSALKDVYRPSHADYTYQQKYGIRDYRGGGRSSARETLVRVVAGAFAMLVLRQYGIEICAYTSQIGDISLDMPHEQVFASAVDRHPVRCPSPAVAQKMEQLIAQVKSEGDSIGGVVSCVVRHCPIGLGEPVFGKLQATLAAAMLSINAAKGFEYGEGFALAAMRGSAANDALTIDADQKVKMQTNHSGGIQGGISNGETIYFRVAFKPTPTISCPQTTVTRQHQQQQLIATGRHDPCIVPRAVPVVEAMCAITLLDALLQQQSRSPHTLTP